MKGFVSGRDKCPKPLLKTVEVFAAMVILVRGRLSDGDASSRTKFLKTKMD